ncbi:hypothetical protein BJV74DRAFT_794193 [Russula compacta]|nr:hypothetical protein BJV74DRAFT_794193 [Russula compacta]
MTTLASWQWKPQTNAAAEATTVSMVVKETGRSCGNLPCPREGVRSGSRSSQIQSAGIKFARKIASVRRQIYYHFKFPAGIGRSTVSSRVKVTLPPIMQLRKQGNPSCNWHKQLTEGRCTHWQQLSCAATPPRGGSQSSYVRQAGVMEMQGKFERARRDVERSRNPVVPSCASVYAESDEGHKP